MIETVTQTSSPATWRPKVGAAAVVVGLAMVKLGQKILEKR